MSAPSIEEGNARLLRLADFLETLPPARFNYGVWVGSNWGGKQDLSCGTTACALGWACAVPEFQDLGLELRRTSYNTPFVAHRALSDARTANTQTEDAAREVFGLNYDGFSHLFIPAEPEEDEEGSDIPGTGEYAATPKQVAAKIRAYVKNDRKVYYDLPNEDD